MWDKPTKPAGLLFALIFGAVYAINKIPGFILQHKIGQFMSYDEVKSMGISEGTYFLCRASPNAPWAQLVFIPAAVAFLPFLLALYFFLATVVEALSSLGNSFSYMQKKNRTNP